ncbi:hypothetical protein MN608_09336 [Microdochium nivale]|nr:hypothetical protein MN608_09336 [Microdochium nivale]
MSQCYDISGKPQPDIVSCLPGNITSPCCGATDLCMSNGLCLNADGNQDYTIQGCTSSNWAEPCKKVCSESDKTDGSGMFYVGYCWDSNPSSGTNDQWCCGHDCCKNQTATKFELPVAKQITAPARSR